MKCTYKQCYLTKACVAFGNAFQIFQAVFFPLPANVETVSQPVTALVTSTKYMLKKKKRKRKGKENEKEEIWLSIF